MPASARLLTGWWTQSLLLTNEPFYELLPLGINLPKTIDGDRRSYSLRYLDGQHPERNVYHVAEEFVVERQGSHATRQPYLVLFVNGIPLVVIECQRPNLVTEGEQATTRGDAGELDPLRGCGPLAARPAHRGRSPARDRRRRRGRDAARKTNQVWACSVVAVIWCHATDEACRCQPVRMHDHITDQVRKYRQTNARNKVGTDKPC